MNKKPHISLPESIIMLLISALSDIFEFAAVFAIALPVIGAGVSFVVFFENFLVLALIQIWLIMKGVRGVWFFAGSLVDFLPFVSFLPLKTITLGLTIFLVNKEGKKPDGKQAAAAKK